MRLTISPAAIYDIESIGDHIAQDNPARALSFISELYNQCQRIGESPETYQKRPELGRDVRISAYGKYLIVFTAIQRNVRIERVLHGARNILRLLAHR
ncbi:type II toxin-antitoxin system RelE/ParE family toxin [Serratia liquefaciens]|jgi:toxin ParE1/3/4|uniref:type II toxin-antitoxin system RelE/ParE family toxin n=1 Tax=Serratia liquefaciens TaxID=614 RepID=UPI00035841A6|nr:type II toxin-antitoxin system RelE/ParE family toxin [Serratia liquefaciens]AGQ32875.1 plasmid stabilization protein [Serratia liquefaciens ATCC 27592]MBF8106807.1 type II toxin-antitoxin system RelE/ParE family toxin [Serratia liquefaciens]MBV0843420.1 type II toxin-antitoxin system RelE/ParE family toxin [Serratia liquefaciens]MCH4197954.1 type II toxin-antitoxin system RelE/ParE family toxin [Serratia liquefaciens]MCH4230708.1 type II toxin-antitoxin system RelE/ParE family toxin [Serra